MKRIYQVISKSKRASDRAIGQFVTTEEQLKAENEIVSKALQEIEEEAVELRMLKSKAENLRTVNEGIIGRIGQIVRGGTTT